MKKMKKMKKMDFAFISVLLISVSFAFQSCLSDDDDNGFYPDSMPNALVTVKSLADKSFYLQLDDSTTLLPTNIKVSPFGTKEVRALVNYMTTNDNPGKYNKAVTINWIDSIRTKSTVPTMGTENDKLYGTDPLEIVNDWVTIAEDGYLTLRFRTYWGYENKTHYINLLTGVNSSNPYEVELRHNANGDSDGRIGDGLIAFNLKDLPDTNGKTVKLKINWKSYSGNKSAEFNYCTRKSSGTATMSINNRSFVTSFK